MIIEILTIITNLSILSLVGYTTYKCIKIRNEYLRLKNSFLKMDAKEILGEKETENNIDDEIIRSKRDRLSSVVAGGSSRQYLGKDFQMSDIDSMTPEQINKLYCRYEGRLGASMTKTLGNSFINLYVMGVSKYFSVANPPKLIEDLEEDPFVNNALNNVCCELYYRYGMFLAPFTTLLTTAKHIDFSKQNITDETENISLENDE